MSNPFQFYQREWIEKSWSPIVHVICAEQMWHFMDSQDYDPLTHEEWAQLPFAFAETGYEEFFDEVLLTLRPNHRDHCVCA